MCDFFGYTEKSRDSEVWIFWGIKYELLSDPFPPPTSLNYLSGAPGNLPSRPPQVKKITDSCPLFPGQNVNHSHKDHVPGQDINQKIGELCWKIVEQKFLSSHDHLLTEKEAFHQWLVFNILDIDQSSKVHKEELGIILQMFAHGVGKAWDAKPLEEFCEEDELTFWQYLECLETKYMPGNDKR